MKLEWPPKTVPLSVPFVWRILRRQPLTGFPSILLTSAIVGIVFAITIVGLDSVLFQGIGLSRVKLIANESFLNRFLLVLQAGVMEEILFRFLIMTGVVWLAGRMGMRINSMVSSGAVWVGILVSALLFGLVHIRPVDGGLTVGTFVVVRAVILNGMAGTVLGWLYWKYGLESAIIAHLFADGVIYLVIASLL